MGRQVRGSERQLQAYQLRCSLDWRGKHPTFRQIGLQMGISTHAAFDLCKKGEALAAGASSERLPHCGEPLPLISGIGRCQRHPAHLSPHRFEAPQPDGRILVVEWQWFSK